MKLKLEKLVVSVEALSWLRKQPINSLLSYKLHKLLPKIDSELKAYEDTRKSLCEKYGKLSKDGNRYEFEGDNAKLFTDELNLVLKEEVELDFQSIPLSALVRIDISEEHLGFLDWLIVEKLEE